MNSPESDLFEQVLFRALCDALGFTGESDPKVKGRIMREAREWFYDRNQYEDFEEVCTLAGYPAPRVRRNCQKLIEAKQSGDHTDIPDFWRDTFKRGRMPSFSAYSEAIDKQLKLS